VSHEVRELPADGAKRVARTFGESLETNRIAGTKLILPDDKTKKEFRQSKRDKMIGSFKLCIDEQGAVDRVSLLKSTGFAAYDAKIILEMNAWAYRPYQVNRAFRRRGGHPPMLTLTLRSNEPSS
jgi:hypothetical protein